MVSALAYHGLTDQMPRKTWVAIGASDWSPVSDYPPVRIVRFAQKYPPQGAAPPALSRAAVPPFSLATPPPALLRPDRTSTRPNPSPPSPPPIPPSPPTTHPPHPPT